MINSLSKDSHITHPSRFQKTHPKTFAERTVNKSAHKFTSHAYSMNNSDVLIKKPVEISFNGLFRAKLKSPYSMGKDLEAMPDGVIRDVLKSAKKFVSETLKIDAASVEQHRAKSKEIIQSAVDFIHKGPESADETVVNFMKEEGNQASIERLLNDTKSVAKKTVDKKLVDVDFNLDDYKDFAKKEIGKSIDVLHSIENAGKIFASKKFHNFLNKAEESQIVFSALFAAGLTCILRPLTIVALPGKKGKDDKKYASAHSMSSGLIGYAVALLIGAPIAMGIKKIENNPEKYLDIKKHKYLLEAEEVKDGIVKNVVKELKDVKGLNKFSVSRKYINMIPEIFLGPPKAIVTIALIPLILKYVFGIEKKVPVTAQNVLKPTQNYLAINFRGQASDKNASTTSAEGK